MQLFRKSKFGFPRQESDRTGRGDGHRGDLGSAAGCVRALRPEGLGERGMCRNVRFLDSWDRGMIWDQYSSFFLLTAIFFFCI